MNGRRRTTGWSWTAAALAALLAGPVRAQEAAAAPVAPSERAAPVDPAAAEPVPEPEPSLLLLRDGRLLWAGVLEHDEEGLRVRRLENGGVVDLTWGLLDPGQAQALRQQWGYVETAAEELLVDAEKLRLADGTELVGVIVHRTEDALHVKTRRSLLMLPKLQVVGAPSRVKVPALDIYSREELYQSRYEELQDTLVPMGAGAPELAPGSPAEAAARAAALEAHWELAEWCERIYDYVHAEEHWRAVAGLDPEWRAEELAPRLAVAERKARAQAEVDELAAIDLMRARGRFDEALAACAAFPERFPDSPLMPDLVKLEGRIARSQLRELEREVQRAMLAQTARLAREAAREMSFEEVVAYLDEGFHEDVLEAVADRVRSVAADATPEDVQRLWDRREGGRWRQATYGQGTWLLGEQRARAGLDEAPEQAASTGEKSDERRALEEKIKRFLENQQMLQRARKQQEGADPEAFWEQWTTAGKANWIVSYYAENSGHFQVRGVRFQNCSECGGTGVREVIYTGGAASDGGASSRLLSCPTCQQIGVVRRISFR